jgi:hypothetical protein
MKIRSILAATLLIGSSLAYAQTCPTTGSTCLVPSRAMSSANTYISPTCPTISSTACPTVATTLPYSGGLIAQQQIYGMQPVVASQPFYVVPQAGIQPTANIYANGQIPCGQPNVSLISTPINTASTCSNVSPDTACLMSQVVGLRNDVHALQGSVRAATLEVRGQQLVSRVNSLMASELLFRQQLAQNPNLPNASTLAFALSQQSDSLNNDLADYNRELSLIPVDQRPYLASDMNSFTIAYWNPTMQRFADYHNSFNAAALNAYQPAYASNPWLQGWQSNYQASLGNLAIAPQNYASVSWWSGSAVAGSMECYPNANPNAVMVPSGSVIYIPANSLSTTPAGICPTPATTTTTVCPPSSLSTTPPSTMGNNFYNTTTPGTGAMAPGTMPMQPNTTTTQPAAPTPPSRGGTGF